jgi:hypothetical protein
MAGYFKGGRGAEEGASMGAATRWTGTWGLARCSGGGGRLAAARSWAARGRVARDRHRSRRGGGLLGGAPA